MRRLVRPRSNRMIAGVCAGVANYFNTDPTVIRIVFLLLLIPGGVPGPLVYLVLWAVMPDEANV